MGLVIGKGSCGAALGAAFALTMMAGTAHATDYYEGVKGDLSSTASSPTMIGNLTSGNNYIVGATIPSGPIIDTMTGQRAVEDDDYVTFTVPTGSVLSQIVLGSNSVFQTGDRMFLGIAQGTGVSVDPSFTSAKGLLGWTLVGAPQAGTNVLPALGLSAPAMFPPIPGATGFSGPLGAGAYTLWLVDGDQPATYSLDLIVSSVPEAGTWAMMTAGLGLIGAALRRRPSRQRVAVREA